MKEQYDTIKDTLSSIKKCLERRKQNANKTSKRKIKRKGGSVKRKIKRKNISNNTA